MSHDAWALDETHIYNYNDSRGLVRATMSKQGKWERVIATNKNILGLKSVSLVCVGGRLLMRHCGLTEQPFIAFDCETLEELPQQEQIRSEGEFKLEYGVGQLSADSVHIERHMTASPLAYDGKYVYAISSERNKNDLKIVLKYAAESYEVKNNVCKFVKRVELK